MSEVPEVGARCHRIMDEFDDELVERTIRKYAMGAEIYWTAALIELKVMAMTPDGAPIQMSAPSLRIILGTPGFLLGKENYVWFFLSLVPFPDEATLSKGIEQALGNMREQKSAQMNGANPNA